MRFDLITLFPDFFTSPLGSGLLGKAIAQGIAEVHCTNPRDFTTDKHHRVDDEPYGSSLTRFLPLWNPCRFYPAGKLSSCPPKGNPSIISFWWN